MSDFIIETEPIENPEYKGGPKRGPWQAMAERPRIARLYLEGKTQAEIGLEFDLSQSQISYELKKIQELWEKSALFDFHRMRAKELARIDHLEREAWEAWQDSKRGKIVKTQERDALGPSNEFNDASNLPFKSKQVTESAGDPRFLAHVEWCIEKRVKLLALEPILKIDDWKHNLPGDMELDEFEKAFTLLLEGEAVDLTEED